MVLDLPAKGCMLMSLASCHRQYLPGVSPLGLGHPGHPPQIPVASELPKPALQQHQGLGGQPPLPWEALGAACNQLLRQKNEQRQDIQCHFFLFTALLNVSLCYQAIVALCLHLIIVSGVAIANCH